MGRVSVVCLLYIAGSPRSGAGSLLGRIVLVLLGLLGCWGRRAYSVDACTISGGGGGFPW